MTDSVPEKLGKYRIIEEVGRGGFAAVYKAVDTTLNRPVALKVLAPHLLWDLTFVQRFQREAEVAANLDHPNVVTIYEVSQVEGVYFIAMQFLDGRTLSQILEAEGPLPASQVRAIVEQVASALDYAHARGFVHRDVKPSNVIVAEDGRATLTDFGLVKAGEGTKLSTTGVVFGTPEYMSPEQAEGMEELDTRSDVYSLGVVVYEMLTGKVPFGGTMPLSVMRGHADRPPPRPSKVNPDVSPAVEAVLLKALAKKRGERYQSAGEMARALTAAVKTKVKVERKEKPAVRGGLPAWAWGAIALAAALVIGGAIFLATQGGKPTITPAPVAQAATMTATSTAADMPTNTPTNISVPTTDTSTPKPPTNTPTIEPTIEPTETLTPVPLTGTLTPSAPPPGMVYVPAGEFIMGSDEGDDDEQPMHTVYLDAFYIDKTEVTNADFAKFVEETGHQTEAEKAGEAGWQAYTEGRDNHPVVKVTWNDADAYCRWAGRRLPTEAEWEKAAKGKEGFLYPWGNEWDPAKANVKESGSRGTVAVGSFAEGVSPYGVFDMAGNVWEWTADWYHAYRDSAYQSEYFGEKFKVTRGGGWFQEEELVTTSNRSATNPSAANDDLGFRCALSSQ